MYIFGTEKGMIFLKQQPPVLLSYVFVRVENWLKNKDIPFDNNKEDR